jgi:hypothetical protein
MKGAGVVAIFCLAMLVACSPQQPGETVAKAPAKTAVGSTASGAATNSPPTASVIDQVTEYELPGSFAPDTTVEALQVRFGKTQVKTGDVPGAEGESFRGVILFPDDSTRRAYLYFQDEKSLRGLSLVRVFEPDSRWRLDNGIAMGTTLAALVERNGRPIEYTGLDWDYGGTVTDLHGGTLAAAEDESIGRGWRLGAADSDQGFAKGAYPIGDATFSSDDPKYPGQGRNVIVRELSVSFPGEDDL